MDPTAQQKVSSSRARGSIKAFLNRFYVSVGELTPARSNRALILWHARVALSLLLLGVKKPAEATGPRYYCKLVDAVLAEGVLGPLNEGRC